MTDRLTPSQEILRYFAYDHLPEPLRDISGQCALIARWMNDGLPDGPEKTTGLRKLLEAKDCFVRAALPPAPAYPLISKSDKLAEFDVAGDYNDRVKAVHEVTSLDSDGEALK